MPDDTLAEAKAQRLSHTLGDVEMEALENLVDAEIQTSGNRPSDVKFEAMGILHLRVQCCRP